MKTDLDWVKASLDLWEEFEEEDSKDSLKLERENCDHDWDEVEDGVFQCTYCQKEVTQEYFNHE